VAPSESPLPSFVVIEPGRHTSTVLPPARGNPYFRAATLFTPESTRDVGEDQEPGSASRSGPQARRADVPGSMVRGIKRADCCRSKDWPLYQYESVRLTDAKARHRVGSSYHPEAPIKLLDAINHEVHTR
jgi:hypothetical protein